MLKSAAAGGQIDIMNDLISRGANNFTDALISACCSGKMKSVRFLSDKTNDYSYAIAYALKTENRKALDYLIEKAKVLDIEILHVSVF